MTTQSASFDRYALVKLCVLGILGFGSAAHGQAVPGCGTLDRGYGPFDYTNPVHVREYLPRVENAHFEPEIQRLEDDEDSASIGANLDYVLGAFPNHHPALNLMTMYLLQYDDSDRLPRGVGLELECYFKRAVAFKPDDGIVRMLYGNYLQRKRRNEEARLQYEQALVLFPSHPELHYNFGLLLCNLNDYDEAMKHARIAYDSGFPLQGLRRRLETVGHWTDETE